MNKKIIDGEKFLRINPKTGDRYLRITPSGIEEVNDFFVEKIKFIGKIKKDDVEADMTIDQFNEWLDKKFAKGRKTE